MCPSCRHTGSENRDWFSNVLGSKPLLTQHDRLVAVQYSIDEQSRKATEKDSVLLKALETGILRVSSVSEETGEVSRMDKKEREDQRHGLSETFLKRIADPGSIGVTFQHTNFESQRAAEAYMCPDSLGFLDDDNSREKMSLQLSGMLFGGKAGWTYLYDNIGNHKTSWQALLDVHPKIAVELNHSSETGAIETNIDIGPLALGTCCEYQTTQWSKFQKARIYRKHTNKSMSSFVSIAVDSSGEDRKKIQAQLFKRSKRKIKDEIQSHPLRGGQLKNGTSEGSEPSAIGDTSHWFPQVDVSCTKAPSFWKVDSISYKQSLKHIINRNSEALVKLSLRESPRIQLDGTYDFHDNLMLTASTEIGSGGPSLTIKAKEHKKHQKMMYQASWKPKRQGHSLTLSVKAKHLLSGLSFSVHASQGAIRGKFYRDLH